MLLAGVIGIVSGLAAVLLKQTVHGIQHFLVEGFDIQYENYFYLAYPAIGIALTTVVAHYVLKTTIGHGIPDLLFTISKKSSIIPAKSTYSRIITSALTVGFGGSVGLEAPVVVTGSAIGSNVGQLTHLNYKKRTLLIGCGAAGAISAIFNAPIGAVIFAIEVLLAEVSLAAFIPLLISSVMGSLVSMVLLGEDALFQFNLSDDFEAKQVPYYVMLGVATGLIGVYFSRVVLSVEGILGKFKSKTKKIILGGLGLGLIIFVLPPMYGEGYGAINNLIENRPDLLFSNSLFFAELDNPYFIIVFLLFIIFFKPIAAALTIGSGGSGGVFAPSLFVGAFTGYWFAYTFNFLDFGIQLPLGHFTLVAMCGVMACTQHAPLSAIFLIAEVTGGYELFVPLMLVSAISFTSYSAFEKYSLYKRQLVEQGQQLPETKDQEVLGLIDICKITETDLLTIHPDAKLADLTQLVKVSKRNIFPVVDDEQRLLGIITLDDIREIMFDEVLREETAVKSLMHSPPAFVYTSESMEEVMTKFEQTGAWNLPVLENERYVGFISKSRIFNAYRKRLIRNNRD